MRGCVTFWTEGGHALGMGHVSRCVNIARELAECGVKVDFLVNDDPVVASRIAAEGLSVRIYPLESVITPHPCGDVVVIDSKKDVSPQARLLKENGRTVVLVDNTGGVLFADALVIPSAFPVASINAGQRGLHAGAEYVIIGRNFIDFKKTHQAPVHSLPLKVLVTMGASDPNGLALKVTEALSGVPDVEVTVVIGPASRPPAALDRLAEALSGKIRLERNVKDMSSLIGSSHVTFTAMGTTVYESAYLGVPCIVIGNYTTDADDLASVESAGIGTGLGFHENVGTAEIKVAVNSYIIDASRWKAASNKASALVDGGGAARIAGLIAGLAAGAKKEEEASKTKLKEVGNA